MAAITNPRKLADWQKRLERFHSSGLTVTQFCRLESVSTTTFYYWEKRVRQEPRKAAIKPVERVRRNSAGAVGQLGRPRAKRRGLPSTGDQAMATYHAQLPGGEQLMTAEPMVHFRFNSKLQVSVPAHCVEALHCLLQWCSRERADQSDNVASQAGVFQQVLVGSR